MISRMVEVFQKNGKCGVWDISGMSCKRGVDRGMPDSECGCLFLKADSGVDYERILNYINAQKV